MKVKASQFAVSLAKIMPLLKTRTTMPILNSCKLHAAESRLTVTGTNLDAFAAATCPCEGDLEPVCVDAAMLNYLVKTTEDTIELEKEKRLKVHGTGTAQLSIIDAAEFPSWPSLAKARTLNIDTVQLSECIKGVAWASDQSYKLVNDIWTECVWIKTTDKTIECCATSGKEFAYVQKAAHAATADLMFPAMQAPMLALSLQTGADVVNLSESFLSTESDTFKVAVKLAEGRFIPVEFLLGQQQVPLGLLEMEPILEALYTIKALSSPDHFLNCRMQFQSDQLTISYKSPVANFERHIPHQLSATATIEVDGLRAIRVFSHVQPRAKATLGQASILFADGDYTYALARLAGERS